MGRFRPAELFQEKSDTEKEDNMKKVKGIAIVLLSVMIAGCSDINSERQEDNSIAIKQEITISSYCRILIHISII